jgi:membrane associated rhomboid family serine protease
MLPLSDTIRSGTVPVVNRIIVILNVIVYVYMASLANFDLLSLGANTGESQAVNRFILGWAFIPATLTTDPLHAAVTILSSMFMHGSLLHIGGNMLFLWVFGDNIEDRLGHVGFAVFYLLGGVAAALAQAFLGGDPGAPTLGASGAIGAVLGAYLVLYPSSGIRTYVPPFFVFVIPAFIYLPYWAFLQYRSLQAGDAGVALWAHIGGFAFGAVAMLVLGRGAPRDRYARY